MHSVTHGIDMPDALWTRLLAFAKRTLVPATHTSRQRGAGGGRVQRLSRARLPNQPPWPADAGQSFHRPMDLRIRGK